MLYAGKVLCLAAAVAAICAIGAAPASATAPGHVYVETNSAANKGGNQIVAYNRAADGSLTFSGLFSAHANGTDVSPPLGFPLTDSQGAISLTPDERLLFAVNTGSNSISSFRVDGDKLVYVDQKPSRGNFPISVDAARGVVYVLNVDPNADNTGGGPNPNVTGYRYDAKGRMHSLPTPTRTLIPRGLPGAVVFDKTGKTLVVTERDAERLTWFHVRKNGTLGLRRSLPSMGVEPFGVDITRRGQAIVADFGNPKQGILSTVSSYDVGLLHDPVNSVLDGQKASCWIVLNNTDTRAFVTSAISQSVTEFSVARTGHVELLADKTRNITGFALDNDLSDGSRFLYVLAANPPGFKPDTTDHLEGFRVEPDGTMTPLGPIAGVLPPNSSGLQAT